MGRQLSRGAPTYDFAKFSQKLHEIERIWTPRGGACPKFYYVDPPLTSPFWRTTNTPVLDFYWWYQRWVLKPGWIPLLVCLFACMQWIHLWCNTCWPLDSQHGSWAFLGPCNHIQALVGFEPGIKCVVAIWVMPAPQFRREFSVKNVQACSGYLYNYTIWTVYQQSRKFTVNYW